MVLSSSRYRCCVAVLSWLCPALSTVVVWGQPLMVQPAEVQLGGPLEQAQLVVRQSSDAAEPQWPDVSGQVQYETADANVVEVDVSGRIVARSEGTTTITVRWNETELQIPVTVDGRGDGAGVEYLKHVNPVITKAGCNMGACHASQHGKAGFKLSVFAFDPDEDFQAIVRDRAQRRVDLLSPADSLILKKATQQIPHGGGRRIAVESVDYQMLHAWLAGGAAAPRNDSPVVERMTVYPHRRRAAVGETQQLRIVAQYSDQSQRDVTAWTRFDSLDEGILEVTPDGKITVVGNGQTAVMARFEGGAEIALFTVPYQSSVELPDWQANNFIDDLAAAKFRDLGIEPSGLCDDATFLRRVFLDCIGSLPTLQETRAFLESEDPRKRELLIDRLLGLTGDPELDIYNDRYAAYWTLKWSDLIRNNSNDLGEQGMWALHNWIREKIRNNVPFDQFVRELVTAKGSVYSNGPANYFLVNTEPKALTEATSQLFMGIRMECAQCHHHPFEAYSQEDYYRLAAFFSRVGLKNSEDFGLFGRERVVVVKTSGEVTHPKTRAAMPPTTLDGQTLDDPLDRRIPLAEWLTSADNQYFAKSVVNRYVAFLLGRGLVEPVDDLRSTNPATNPELFDALAADFAAHDFDLKHLLRTILRSRLYQLDSQATVANASDDRFYSHYYVKRMAAEPLLDGVDLVTGSTTKYPNLPLGTLAVELPDAEYPNYFLNTFAKPRRTSVCECERSQDPSLSQSLHMLNGDILMTKIADPKGHIARWIKEGKSPDDMITELYLAAYSRFPSDQELEVCRGILNTEPLQQSVEDLCWAVLNTKEFQFVH